MYHKGVSFRNVRNILQSGESLEVLAKLLNQDLQSLSQWLKANKLSLNVRKTFVEKQQTLIMVLNSN